MNAVSQDIHYYPALDGVRGWSALCVLIAHVHLAWLPGAMVLMDLFFAISGFLITSIIWRGARKRGRIDLLQFWKRRLQRLYPVLLLVVAVFTLAAYILLEDPVPSYKDALTTLLYVSNFTKLYDYVLPTLFGQTWSLGVEEQFYLLWPLLFWLFLQLRLEMRGVTIFLGCLALACMLWKAYLIHSGVPWSRLYYAPDTRLDAFVVGGMLAIYHPRLLAWCQSRLAHGVLVLAGCALIVLVAYATPREMVYFLWQQSLALVLSAALILLLTSPRPSLFKWLFSLRPSVFVGQRCYSIYLWHWPIIWLLLVTVRPDPLVMLIIVAPLVMVLSCLSYHYLELPFMSRRNTLSEFPQPQSKPDPVRPGELPT